VGRVGFGFGSNGSGQFDFLEEIGLGRVRSDRVGSGQFICCVFQIIDRFRVTPQIK
jgi:hypothetical protein